MLAKVGKSRRIAKQKSSEKGEEEEKGFGCFSLLKRGFYIKVRLIYGEGIL